MTGTILITGATGNVGYEVIQAFDDTSNVRAAVRDVDKASATLGDDITCVRFDFEDASTFAAAFDGVKRLFLMRPPAIANVQDHIAPVIDAAKAAGVAHIVFLSLMGVENNKIVPHYKIEQLILESGLAYTFLRAGFFMQNLNTTHAQDIRDNDDIFIPAGDAKTSFIDVRDIGAVAAKTLSENGHENKAYTLTGGQALDYHEVADIFSEVLGRNIRYSNPSHRAFGKRMHRGYGHNLVYVLVMNMLYTNTRHGNAAAIAPDTAELLKREPITMRQYVKDYRETWL